MDKASYTRVIVAIFVIVNNILLAIGYEPIGDDFINAVITIVGNVYVLYPIWKNNYLSKKGIRQKQVLQRNDLTK